SSGRTSPADSPPMPEDPRSPGRSTEGRTNRRARRPEARSLPPAVRAARSSDSLEAEKQGPVLGPGRVREWQDADPVLDHLGDREQHRRGGPERDKSARNTAIGHTLEHRGEKRRHEPESVSERPVPVARAELPFRPAGG